MKKCKYCQSEIDEKAKVCPNCKKKQGGKGKWIMITLVVIIVIGLATSQGNDEVQKVNGENGAPSENTKNDTLEFKKGETAEYKNIRTTLLDVVSSDGSEFMKAEDGKEYVTFEFEIENNSDSDLSMSTIMCFEAYCDGYACDLSLGAITYDNSKQQLDGTIAPGKKMKGIVGYEVTKGWNEFEVQFKPNVWSDKKIVFKHVK